MKFFICNGKKIFIIMCVIITLYLIILPALNSNNISETNSFEISNGWNIYSDGKLEKENVELPYQIKNADTTIIELYNTIPITGFEVESLSFINFQKNVWIYIDNELIFEKVFKPTWHNKNTPGNGTVLTALPMNSQGKELYIKFEKVKSDDDAPISMVSIIDARIKFNSEYNNIIFILMCSLTFIGIILLITSVIYKKIGLDIIPLVALSLFIISISIWVMCNGKMIEAFTENNVLAHNIEYISFYFIPIGMWMYIRHNWHNPCKSSKFIYIVMLGFYTFSIILKSVFQVDFYTLLKIYHFLLFINIPFLVYEIIRKRKNKLDSFKLFCIGIIILSVCAVFELVRYYTIFSRSSTASAIIYGITFLSVFLILSFIFATKEKLEISYGAITKNYLDVEHRRYEVLINNTKDVFMDWDLETDTIYFSEQYEIYFKKAPFNKDFLKNLIGSTKYVEYNRDLYELYDLLIKGSKFEKVIGMIKDVETKWFDAEFTTIFDNNNKGVRVVGIIKDITQSKKLEEEFIEQSQYLQLNYQLYDNILEADIATNTVISDNSLVISEMLGLKGNLSYDVIIKAISEQIIHENFRDEYVEILSRDRILSLYNDNKNSFEYEFLEKADGVNYKWTKYIVRIFKSDITNTIRIIAYIKNIDDEKKKELELLNNSQIDMLSGLLNKMATKITIDEYLNESEAHYKNYVFMMIDVDKFKNINDTLGHSFGDLAITEISQKLKIAFDNSAIIGRIGGDEFVVFFNNANDIDWLEDKCKDLCNKFNYSYSQDGKSCEISISVGICLYPKDGASYDILYKNADKALYISKESGRNRYSFYR